mmetsp:Transcript_27502/g.49536  ORF Transcript_27502/g.49536 Transcript_27502/m.49536 type:complete len:190 (+) Transcript_27502:210-779(+)|eukprot:CAMPEP_0204919160 /NCGR_PEP_ID=MMETSP1397-20131031/16668_1 /ASSEMBLY_ACC=CAM_ASM_000891 /TAXON_ID=49980 /ORGANISM="Climacostomum Climacostomum virens, Strain Stock W-24" /LENGTH=189 /DNA_ID=CAMNT_0052092727 /DNA_START=12 /DNA_END=581 /DNA_ORIENTATION=-
MALIWLLIASATADDGEDCTLLGGDDASKPSPSLVKCYRFNKLSCCVSAHDQTIKDDYEDFMSASCQREYNDMEDYFCFGCHPDQGQYVDIEKKEVYICESYAEEVWGDDMDSTSDEYDNCGMYSYWRNTSETIVQSLEWKNGAEFFAEVKPPYFQDYTIVIVGNGDDRDCFGSAVYWAVSVLAVISWF